MILGQIGASKPRLTTQNGRAGIRTTLPSTRPTPTSLSLSALLFVLSYRVDQFRRNRQIAFNLALLLMVGGFVGGRLLHVFYEEWPYYAADLKQILFFWNGGFVYYGGFLVAWPLTYFYCRKRKESFFPN